MVMDLHPKARELLTGPNLGHLGYVGLDGDVRVIPLWFAFDGEEIRVASPAGDYKCRSLRAHPRAAMTVSTPLAPYHVATAVGTVAVEELPEPERVELVRSLAVRYLGPEAGEAYVAGWAAGGSPGSGELLRMRVERVRYVNVSGE
jgi:PPOX class probable F420-dependent enzyme